MIPAVLLALALQDPASLPPVQGGSVAPETNPTKPQGLDLPQTVAEPNRLAITPKVDGRLDTEEWDPFASVNGMDSYYQWEPSKAHFAARAPVGQDLLVSLDMKGDGWYVGADNLEIRAKWNGASAEFQVRRMVVDPGSGPKWIDASDLQASMVTAASGDSSFWTVEISVEDPGLGFMATEAGKMVGVRMDSLSINDSATEPFASRAMAMVTNVFERGTSLPTGLRWKTEYKGRSVMIGENIRVRYSFDGSDGLTMKRIEMRTEGWGRDFTNSLGVPFPSFDRKFRAFVDYDTKVADGAPHGWRVARATVYDAQDNPSVLQSSYEIAPPISFDWNQKTIPTSTEKQDVRLDCHIRSNTTKRVDGVFRVIPPSGWAVKNGNDKTFTLALPRARKRQVFEIEVPGGFKGSAPIKLVSIMGGYQAERTVWLIVQ